MNKAEYYQKPEVAKPIRLGAMRWLKARDTRKAAIQQIVLLADEVSKLTNIDPHDLTPAHYANLGRYATFTHLTSSVHKANRTMKANAIKYDIAKQYNLI
jgi:hypothetical protein